MITGAGKTHLIALAFYILRFGRQTGTLVPITIVQFPGTNFSETPSH
jgi:hypothetical protein